MKQLRKTFMEKKKNNKNFNRFLLLWSGELVSAIGGGLTSFGLGVYIFQQTGSAAEMAVRHWGSSIFCSVCSAVGRVWLKSAWE